MTTILTKTGWEDENGNPLGRWTRRADLVAEGDIIAVVAPDVIANTDGGNDIMIGTSNFTPLPSPPGPPPGIQLIEKSGIVNFGTIYTGNGNDNILGTGVGFGISNRGRIGTGNGNDNILGTGNCVGIFNSALDDLGIINTGRGNDNIIGNGDIAGLTNLGTIHTENGKDKIIGTNLPGPGEDIAGINNTGVIDTGRGNDIVDALTGGFASFGRIPTPEGNEGVGTINLGEGQDLIRGFGEQIVDGDRGFDTAELGIDFDENLITFGSPAPTSIDITFDSATMSFTDVELFDFNGQEFALEQLQDMV